eukprot:11896338-Prorocentrum_lima.AAC.1
MAELDNSRFDFAGMVSDTPNNTEWGGYGDTPMPMPRSSFPAWQPRPNTSTPSSGTACEYCNDMHTHTDTES